MTETRMVDRRTGRVLLIDAAHRVLLFRGFDPAMPEEFFWFTPGGGLDPGESSAQGAARELREETGLAVEAAALGEPVWEEYVEFSFDNVRYRQPQQFFLLRVEEWAVTRHGLDRIERQTIVEHRWWSVEELAATAEQIYPAGLAHLLGRLLAR